MEPHCAPAPQSSDDASSSYSAFLHADLRPVACDASVEEGVLLNLDAQWAAAAEAERILGEAAAVGAAAALKISGEEEQQEEDGIRDNQQRQDDELMALEAIYGPDLVVFKNKGGLRYFQIYIRYDVSDGIEVSAKLSSANVCAKDDGCSDGTGHDDGSDVFYYKCNFEYLPLLVLTCLLPPSYPNKDSPYFTITVKWMDEAQVSQLCEMLDNIWAELQGQEVAYQWVEWLRDSSRSHLWFDDKMTLGPDIVIHNHDNRAVSRTNSLESLIPLMMTYSSKKRYQAFLEDLHMCMICLNQSKGSNFIKLSCQHLFCAKCMETLCRMHVKEGTVFQLVCPDTKCNASIPPYVLKRLLTVEEFERWDRLVLKKALDSMSDVVYCPRCGIGCLEDESNNAQCPKCSFIFCSLCKEPCHPGKQCITPEDMIKRQQAPGRMSEKEMARELLTIRKMFSDIQLCPKCRMPIVKTEGCNKMSCGNCGQLLCFRCGRAIDGYDHFWNGGCVLFELRQYSDVMPFERHMEEVQIGRRVGFHPSTVIYGLLGDVVTSQTLLLLNEIRVTGHSREKKKVQLSPIGSTIRCPKCRQRNFKDNEEYIFCWACRIHYCSLCRMRVEDKYMKSGHYGSSECVGLGNF